MSRLSPAARVAKGALLVYLKPRLAQDSKIDLDAILAGMTNKDIVGKRGIIAAACQAQFKSHLAQDADLEDIGEILEALGPILEKEEGDDMESNSGMPMAGHPYEEDGEMPEFLKEKGCTSEDWKRAMDMVRQRADDAESEEEEREREVEEDKHWADDAARRADDARRKMGRDESEEEREKREKEQGEDRMRKRADDRKRAMDKRMARDKRRADDARKKLGRDETEEEEKERKEREGAEDRKRAMDRKVARDAKRADDRKAMDAKRADDRKAMDGIVRGAVDSALKTERQNQTAIIAAREAIRPWVGSLPVTMSFDSAPDVFKKGLELLHVPTDGMHPTAYEAVLRAQPQPGQRDRGGYNQAHDALPTGVKPMSDRIPGSDRITVMG